MGKKTRKTRWRTLSISGPQSDEETSHETKYYGNTNGSGNYQHRPSRGETRNGHAGQYFHQNGGGKYWNGHTSSQSTPTRHAYTRSNSSYEPTRQSTRSNSTASGDKITFNEDEYTRITTPRQDVLFKKGYLSKPKPYLQQKSNGSNSTGGSTGNGTPDHHSADGAESTESVEYEQNPFMYPNSFIDHNGICYFNGVPGFEPFPGFFVYNTGPPMCYPPYVPSRVKRYSTDSMTESTSPNTEPQENTEPEASTNGQNQEFSNQPVFNYLYPGYVYGNGQIYQQPEIVQNDVHSNDPRKLKKKRRRRKLSRSKPPNEETSNGYTDEEYSSDDEIVSQSEDQSNTSKDEITNNNQKESLPLLNGHSEKIDDQTPDEDTVLNKTSSSEQLSHSSLSENSDTNTDLSTEHAQNLVVDNKPVPNDQTDDATVDLADSNEDSNKLDNLSNSDKTLQTDVVLAQDKPKYRVDAEEFIPRAYRHGYDNQIITNFVQLPIIGDIYPATFPNPPFMPPLNFIPVQNNFIPNQYYPEQYYVRNQPNNAPEDDKTEVDDQPINTTKPETMDDEQKSPDHKKTESTNVTSPRRSTDKKRNDKTKKDEPKDVATDAVKTEETKNIEIVTNGKPSNEIIKNDKIKSDAVPSPTFSKMLKSSISMIETKSPDCKPAYKKQTSLNGPTRSPNQNTIKKSNSSSRYNRRSSETKNLKADARVEKPQVSIDSWINVSRKKRKNKSVVENVDDFEPVESSSDSLVLEPSIEVCVAEIEKTYELQAQKIDDVKTDEKHIIKSDETVIKTDEIGVEESVSVSNKKQKKVEKSKTKPNRNKRIIINDGEIQKINDTIKNKTIVKNKTDVENKIDDKTEDAVEIVEDATDVSKDEGGSGIVSEVEVHEGVLSEVEVHEEVVSDVSNNDALRPDEAKTEVVKSKKKKRKNKKLSTSVEESYDFLIESTLSDPDSKTNVEVSLEIDRMIQRGLYANLEEKLKSFNPSDSFIKSGVAEDFSIDFGSSAFNKGDKLKNFDFNGVLFNTTMNKTLEKVMLYKNDEKKTSTDKSEDDKEGGFLITKAVKEWMVKTRENTPEVEILKSVDEIKNEYMICNDIESEDEDEMPKNAKGLPVRVQSANEFRTRESSCETTPDLLDCWEPDIEIKNYDNEPVEYDKKMFFNNDVQKSLVPDSNVEQGEDVLEIYESVYGKNEDFLRIQKEIENRKTETKSLNYPKSGGLPYRAICCNVM